MGFAQISHDAYFETQIINLYTDLKPLSDSNRVPAVWTNFPPAPDSAMHLTDTDICERLTAIVRHNGHIIIDAAYAAWLKEPQRLGFFIQTIQNKRKDLHIILVEPNLHKGLLMPSSTDIKCPIWSNNDQMIALILEKFISHSAGFPYQSDLLFREVSTSSLPDLCKKFEKHMLSLASSLDPLRNLLKQYRYKLQEKGYTIDYSDDQFFLVITGELPQEALDYALGLKPEQFVYGDSAQQSRYNLTTFDLNTLKLFLDRILNPT
eukprot:COSAG01_NODE_1_length_100484_cov_170.446142_43_plen_264_part_00